MFGSKPLRSSIETRVSALGCGAGGATGAAGATTLTAGGGSGTGTTGAGRASSGGFTATALGAAGGAAAISVVPMRTPAVGPSPVWALRSMLRTSPKISWIQLG
ncbi:hypothetical protein C4F17_22690 [Variovorax sp. PMC12]|nr:hypothetical protein C4F17_22690 [Variovorax sp. PMC12]